MTDSNTLTFTEGVGAFTIALVIIFALGFVFGAGGDIYIRHFGPLPECESGNIIWGEAEEIPRHYLLVCEK